MGGAGADGTCSSSIYWWAAGGATCTWVRARWPCLFDSSPVVPLQV